MPHWPRLFVLQDTTCQHQRPCGRVHQRGCRLPQMLPPIRWRDLVFDQRIDGFGVRHAQQSLGQTHQRDAFVGGQTIFSEKDLHQTWIICAANLSDQCGGIARNRFAILRCQLRHIDKRFDTLRLLGKRMRIDSGVTWNIEGHFSHLRFRVFLQLIQKRQFVLFDLRQHASHLDQNTGVTRCK